MAKPQTCEVIFVKHTIDKVLVFRVYKILQEANKENK